MCGFCFIFVFYVLFSFFLQVYFCRLHGDRSSKCDIQDQRQDNIGCSVAWFPVLELLGFDRKTGRAPNHALYSTMNLMVACTFAGTVACAALNGNTRLAFSIEEAGGLLGILVWTSASFLWESIIEYYWHRMMHLPWFYKRFHKIHHFYTFPEPFDDMYIHPIEAFGYYCILYSPPFIMPLHVGGFVFYMSIMGICGVLDHCGIRISLLGLYDSADHSMHHSRFNVNYGFPFPFTDVLHGTYAPASPQKKVSARPR